MKIEKFDSKSEIGRIPLAEGDYGNADDDGKKFVLSVLVDGSGIVLEFADDEAYLISSIELVTEILKERAHIK